MGQQKSNHKWKRYVSLYAYRHLGESLVASTPPPRPPPPPGVQMLILIVPVSFQPFLIVLRRCICHANEIALPTPPQRAFGLQGPRSLGAKARDLEVHLARH